MSEKYMTLKILLPYQVYAEKTGVTRIVAETSSGALGLLPQLLDCAASLEPGILTCESEAEGEQFIAIDRGILVKTGSEVLISVRNATGGVELAQLYAAVEREFAEFNEREQNNLAVLRKMESGFIERLARYYHGK